MSHKLALLRFALLFPLTMWMASCSLETKIEDLAQQESKPTISIGNLTLTEGQSGSLVLTLSKVWATDVVVNYVTSPSTATAGVDYTTMSGALTFVAGSTTSTISLTSIDDNLYEGAEAFSVDFTAPSDLSFDSSSNSTASRAIAINDDEVRPTVSFTVSTETVSENIVGAVHTVTVQLSGLAQAPVTVQYSNSGGGTATGGGVDYSFSPGMLTFASGTSSQTFTILIINDLISEPTETINLALTAPTIATLGSNATQVISITDDETAPTIQFALANSAIAENLTPATITVRLTNPSSQSVSVNYAVTGGTATQGTDYTLNSATLTFAAGETVKTFTAVIVNDIISEANETVEVTLSSPVNASIGGISAHELTINDNDGLPVVQFAAATQNSNESVGTSQIALTLTNPSSQTVTVNYSVTGGSAAGGGVDFTLVPGTVTFPAGSTTQNVTISIVNDAIYELSEDIQVSLVTPINATIGPVGLHTHNIIDNDTLPVLQFATAADATLENAGTKNIAVSLSGASSQTVTADYTVTAGVPAATGSGVDYALASGTLTIAAGSTLHNISVAIADDSLAEGDERFVVTLSNVSSSASLGSPSVHTHTITDNEGAPTIQFASSTSSASEGTATHDVIVNMSVASATEATITYSITGGTATAGGVDYTATATGTLTFAAGVTTQSITMSVVDDVISESAETTTLSLSAPTGATLGAQNTHVHTILDNDGAPVIEFEFATSSASESSSNHPLTVTVVPASASAITVDYAVTGGTATGGGVDYTLANGTLTFAAGVTTRNIDIAVVDDLIHESNETVIVTLSNPTGATIGVKSANNHSINDNDAQPTVQMAASSASVTEGTSNLNIVVSLSGESFQQITVAYSTGVYAGPLTEAAGGGIDYSLPAGTLTFAAGVTSMTIALAITDDNVDELAEGVAVTLASPTNSTMGTPVTTQVTINDNDDPPVISFASSFDSFTENTGSHTVVVNLDRQSSQAVTIGYSATGGSATGGGVDYTLTPGTLTFSAGQTVQSFTYTIVDDSISESTELINISLASPTNATLGTPALTSVAIIDDETLPVLGFAASTDSTNESTATKNILVNMSGVSSSSVTFSYAVTGGTATGSGTDYTLANGTATIAAGSTVATITLAVVNDSLAEGNETIQLTISSPNAYATIGATDIHNHTIVDDDGAPTVYFAAATSSSAENVGSQTIAVVLSGPDASQVTIDYAVTSTIPGVGIADATDDYTLANGTLTFAAGETTKNIVIAVVNDSVGEPDEAISLALSNISGGLTTLGAQSTHVFTILANDTPTLSFSSATSTVAENVSGGSHNVVVGLSNIASSNAIVDFALSGSTTGGGVDYSVLTASPLTITAGSTTATIAITIVNDIIYESSETLVATLSNASASATLGSPSVHTVTITDDEAIPQVRFNSANSTEVEWKSAHIVGFMQNEFDGSEEIGNGAAFYTVAATVTLNATTAPDGTMTATQLFEASGAGLSTHQVGQGSFHPENTVYTSSVYVKAGSIDRVAIGAQLRDGSYTDATYRLVGNGVITYISPNPNMLGATITPSKNGWYRLSITYNNSAGASGTPNFVSIVNASDTNNYDAGAGGGSIYVWGYQVEQHPQATAYLKSPAGSYAVKSSGYVQINRPSAFPVTVNYAQTGGTATGSGTDYSVSNGTLTFAPGETIKSILMPVVDDTIYEGNETVVFTLSGQTNATLGTSVHTHTITDDDIAPVLSIATTTAMVSESVGTHNVVVDLPNPSSQNITFTISLAGTATGGGTDYTLATTHTIPAGATSYTMPIVINDDAISESNETITVTMTSASAGSSVHATLNTQTVTVTDNDAVLFTWLGTTGDGKWSTAGNWAGGAVPGSADLARFDSSCASNCNVSVDVAVDVDGVDMAASYTGTISNSVQFVKIGTAGWLQAGGTYTSGIYDEFNGHFVLNGGVFNAANINTYFAGDVTFGAGTFNPRSGGVIFAGKLGAVHSTTFNNTVFNKLMIGNDTGGYGGYTRNFSGTATVNSDFQIYSNTTDNSILLGGTFNLKGHVYADSLYHTFTTSVFNINGASAQAVYSNSDGNGVVAGLSNVNIANTSGGVTFNNNFMNTGNWTRTSGTVTFNGAISLYFRSPTGVTSVITPGGITYSNVVFRCATNFENSSFTVGNNMFVSYQAKFERYSGTQSCALNGNVLLVSGPVESSVWNGTSNWQGTTDITMTGSVDADLQVAPGATLPRGTFSVTKTGGAKVNLLTNISLSGAGQDLAVLTGGIRANNHNLAIADNLSTAAGTTIEMGCGSLTYLTHSPANGTISASSSSPNVTINDRNQNEANSGSNPMNFVVSLSEPVCGGIFTIAYATANNSATAGSDYVATSGTLTIAAGGTVGTIVVTINGDATVEGHEGFYVNLTTASAGTITDNQGIGLIQNDDTSGFTWTGASGVDLNWNRAANWANGIVPGLTNTVNFAPGSCSGTNCNANINVAALAANINVLGGFAGTITQVGANTLTVGTNFNLAQGTFVGGSGDITIGGAVAVSGGALTSTSGLLSVAGNWQITNSPTFNHNEGTLRLRGGGGCATVTVRPGVVSYKHVQIGFDCAKFNFNAGTMTVTGNLTFGTPAMIDGQLLNGTITVAGDITTAGVTAAGTATVRTVGVNQSISTTQDGWLPHFIIASTGTVTLGAEVSINGSFTYSSGTINASGSTLKFHGTNGGSTLTIQPGAQTYNNVDFGDSSHADTYNLNGSTFNVGGNLNLIGGGNNADNGTFVVNGNIFADGFAGGTATVTASTTTSQTIATSNAPVGYIPNLVVAPSGTATFVGTVNVRHAFQKTSGTLVTTGSTLNLAGSNGCLTYAVRPSSTVYNNVNFGGLGCSYFDFGGQTFTIDGNVTHQDPSGGSFLNNGILNVKGNYSALAGAYGGSATLNLTGAAQTISQVSDGWLPHPARINTTGTISLATDLTTGANNYYLYVQNGTLDMNGHSLNWGFSGGTDNAITVAPGAKIYKGCGTLTAETLVNNGTIYNGSATTLSVANAANVTEGGNAQFVVTSTPVNCVATTFDYATAGGTALNGGDFAATGGNGSLASGVATTTINVVTVEDTENEPTEYFTLTLSNLMAGVTAGTIVGTGGILDNDSAPSVTFATSGTSYVGGDPDPILVLNLSAVSGYDVLVPITFSGSATSPEDYAAPSSPVTILAGQTSVSIPIVIAPVNDIDQIEVATFTLGTPTNATLGAITSHNLTIDDATPAYAPAELLSLTSSTANGTKGVGNSISIQVTFDLAVNVTGNPTLLLETGTTDRTATYSSGSGSTTLTFLYTVQAGDISNDLDAQSTAALSLNGGTIHDVAHGNPADIIVRVGATSGSLATNKNLIIDGALPTAPTNFDDGSFYYSATSSPPFSLSASTDVGAGVVDYDIAIGTSVGATNVMNWTTTTSSLTATYAGTFAPFTNYYASTYAKDGAGNFSSVTNGDGWKSLGQQRVIAQNVIPPARGGAAGAQMGASVAFSADGLTMAVGAPAETLDAAGNPGYRGAVYVYVYSSGWTLQQKIVAADAAYLGNQVVFDGNILIAAAYDTAYGTDGNNGAVYEFTRSGSVWSQTQKIYPTGTNAIEAGKSFGVAMAIDNGTLVVGADRDDYDESGANSMSDAGSAYIYVRSGGPWVLQQKIVGFGTNGRVAGDGFGNAVDVSGDVIAVGARLHGYNASGAGLASQSGAVFTYARSGGVWSPIAKLVGSGTNGRLAADQFGYDVALNGSLLVVGAPYQDWNATGASSLADAGAIYTFSLSGSVWSAPTKYVGSGTNGRVAGDNFGSELEFEGSNLFVAVPGQGYNDSGAAFSSGAGAVYHFTYSAGTYSQSQRIVATGTNARAANDRCGSAMAVNGSNLVIGCILRSLDQNGANPITGAGAAYVYAKATTWDPVTMLVDTTVMTEAALRDFSYLGYDVDISEDGLTMVAGAPYDQYDVNGANRVSTSGAVYVYVRSGNSWVLQQKLIAAGTNARNGNENFGAAVAISGDTIVVGAQNSGYDSSGANNVPYAGAVYVFKRTGSTWSQEQRITATGTNSRNFFDAFGRSVDISGDSLIVGSNNGYDASGANLISSAGSAYVYTRSGSTWSLQQKIVATGTNSRVTNDGFSQSVAISSDTAVIGAPAQDTDSTGANSLADAGAVFVFKRSGSVWSLEQKLVAVGVNARESSASFGYSVGLSGNTVLIGAPASSTDVSGANGLSGAGAAFVFTRSGSVWTQQQKMVASGRASADSFGRSVAISLDNAVVGSSSSTDENYANALSVAGAAYTFVRKGTSWSPQQKLVPTGLNARNSDDEFGADVSIVGSTLAIGVPAHSYDSAGTNPAYSSGACFMYTPGP